MTRWLIYAVLLLCAFGALRFVAGRTLYYPIQHPGGNWAAREAIGAEDVWIREDLHGWFVEGLTRDFVTLHLHGNGGNITHRTLTARHVLAAGSAILLLDYRGYGRSSGRPTEAGLYEDAHDAWKWLVARGYEPSRMIVHGESLGTAVAAELATRERPAGVVLEAPFTSAKAVAGQVLPLLGPLLVSGYDTLVRMDEVRAPVFIIHGDADEVIAYRFGEELYRAAREPKYFWRIPGGTHNDLHIVAGPEFPSRLRTFYESLR